MCKGDDPTCPAFEVHHRQFVEDMARERRAFLASKHTSGVNTAGLAMTRPQSSAPRHHLPANADTVHWGYFSKKLRPLLEVDSGDIVTIETLTHQASDDHERMIEGDPGAESVYLWTKDKKGVNRRGAGPMDGKLLGRGAGEGLGVHICTGPIFVRNAEPGDVIELRIMDIKPRPCANPSHTGKSFGSNAAAWWGFHYKELITELYLWALARHPRAEELKVTLEFVTSYGERKAEAAQDLLWALLNTREFIVNH